jgi:tRNA A58 N-methylase Trm61
MQVMSKKNSAIFSEKTIKEHFEENKAGWKKSFLNGFSQDEHGDAVPWMTYAAIDFLKANLKKTQRVFEFGLGASTLFFSPRVKKVVSLETRESWQGIVEKMREGKFHNNVEIALMHNAMENSAYETFAKDYAAQSGEKFDLIVIDSLKRFECAKNSIDALKPDGSIILDDSERENYKKIFDFFEANGFQKTDFFGIAPGQLKIKNTTIFKR